MTMKNMIITAMSMIIRTTTTGALGTVATDTTVTTTITTMRVSAASGGR